MNNYIKKSTSVFEDLLKSFNKHETVNNFVSFCERFDYEFVNLRISAERVKGYKKLIIK